jgi:hypothetical protein
LDRKVSIRGGNRYVDPEKQELLRHTVAEHLTKLKRQTSLVNNNRRLEKQEWKIMTNIREKIKRHNLLITRADNGRMVVVMGQVQYNDKVMEFIYSNGITLPHNNVSVGH